jgi:hypothetical protein
MNAPDHRAMGCSMAAPDTDRAVPVDEDARLTVSLKTLARQLDAHRSSVRRWLREAGIRPVVLGRGRNGAIRYRWADVEAWLASLPQVE